jgi:hypothetical protein
MLTPLTASASGFHEYATAFETSGNSGMYSTHIVQGVSNQASDGCSTPYSGTPVYETEWLLFNSNATTWDEVGVGHQCNDSYRYFYWGYGYNGA